MEKQYTKPEVDLMEIHFAQVICTSSESMSVSIIDDIEEDGEIIVL